jgi:cytoskeletal protein RodZ
MMTTEFDKSAENGQGTETTGGTASVGAALREARERQGISLEDVARKTNIRLNYLEAIEQERFDAVPGDVFVRGIIRQYGNFLGLDGMELVRQYRAVHGGEGVSQTHSLPVRESHNVHIRPSFKSDREAGSGMGSSHKSLWFAVLAVLVILALGAGFYFYSGRPSLSLPLPSFSSFLPGHQAPPENKEPAAPPREEPRPATVTNQPAPAKAERTTLEIRAARDKCWLEVKEAGGRVLYSGTLDKGEKRSFESDKSLTVVMGYPRGLDIIHNGTKLPVISLPGVVERTFGPAHNNPKK